jgi:hypothetical protein
LIAEKPAVKQEHSKTSDDQAKKFAPPRILTVEETQAYLQGCAETIPRLLSCFL